MISSMVLLGSTRCGPRCDCCLVGIILSCSGVTLGGAAGFGDLVAVVSGTLGAAIGEACSLTRDA